MRQPPTGGADRRENKKGRFTHKGMEDVMSAGFAAHLVGELEDAGKKTSRIIWARVPTQSDGREALVLWHNHLVDLCCMTGREFRSLLAKNIRAEE